VAGVMEGIGRRGARVCNAQKRERERVCEGESECGQSLGGSHGTASTQERWQRVVAWPGRCSRAGDKGVRLGEEKGRVEGRPMSGADSGWGPANRGGKRLSGGATRV
jgi:hypothetical protein